MTLTEWQRKAIGVPFVPFGRDYTGWDCWGLVIRAWQDVAGVTLPDFTYKSIKDYRALAANFASREGGFWRRLDAPEPMAVACIYRRGRVIHAGLFVGNRRILHVERGIETCIESVANVRVEGYYTPAHAAGSGGASV